MEKRLREIREGEKRNGREERIGVIGTSGADRTSNVGRADEFPAAGTAVPLLVAPRILDGQYETFASVHPIV